MILGWQQNGTAQCVRLKHQLNLPPQNMEKQELMGSSESSASLLPYGESRDLPKQHIVEKREDSENKQNNGR